VNASHLLEAGSRDGAEADAAILAGREITLLRRARWSRKSDITSHLRLRMAQSAPEATLSLSDCGYIEYTPKYSECVIRP
jgi:hypothetical protein